ncbi:MAG: hypothetical protein KBD58_07005, partial [Thermomonas sp.]|nr:hypothetical protein [Thermomonas sp.]
MRWQTCAGGRGWRRFRRRLAKSRGFGDMPAFRRTDPCVSQVPSARHAPLQWRIARIDCNAMALNPYDLFDVRSLLS